MIRTFQTRPQRDDDRLGDMLGAYAELMSRAERRILAWIKAGKPWTAEHYASVYRDLGLSAVLFRMARASLDGKLKSVTELAKIDVAVKAAKIATKKIQVATKASKLSRARPARAALLPKIAKCDANIAALRLKADHAKTDADQWKTVKVLRAWMDKRQHHRDDLAKFDKMIVQLKHDLHQHKRRLEVLTIKLARAERMAANPSICFGSKKLFRARYHLEANGYRDHAEWREQWHCVRSSTFLLVGAASAPAGNEMARLKLRDDGLFDLELRLPPALAAHADEVLRIGGATVAVVRFHGLDFNRGEDAVVNALVSRQPITIRFHRDDRGWRIMVSVDDGLREAKFDDDYGCLGVDFNADHIAVTLADKFGNPIRTWTIPIVTYGRSADQTLDAVRKAAAEVAKVAKQHGVPVASETLDFAGKKSRLKDSDGPRYARMLSSLAYSSFDAALASACCRAGIHLRRVNPAFTSLIGRVKFAPRYGLSVHAAAALSIARRAMGTSERMPAPVSGELSLPLASGGHVTLARPARIARGHVWSQWGRLNKGWKAALAARGRTGFARSPVTPPDGPNVGGCPSRRRHQPPSSVGLARGDPR